MIWCATIVIMIIFIITKVIIPSIFLLTWQQVWLSMYGNNTMKCCRYCEEWIYVLTTDADAEKTHWWVLNSVHGKWKSLPPMPGPMKIGFGYVVICRKLLVMVGLFDDDSGTAKASKNIYMYESALNRYIILPFCNCIRSNSI